jgi:hypothetical protein
MSIKRLVKWLKTKVSRDCVWTRDEVNHRKRDEVSRSSYTAVSYVNCTGERRFTVSPYCRDCGKRAVLEGES